MRRNFSLTAITFLLLLFTACKKNGETFVLNTDIWIVNADINMAGIKVDPGRNIVYANDSSIKYGTARQYALLRSSIPFKVVNAADTTSILYNNPVQFKSGVYTIFVVGQAPSAEIIINEESGFPFIRQDKIFASPDSVVNVRFVNLSPNSVPVKIKIASVTSNEVDNLPYKGIGNWKAYTATATTTTYAFQIRDAVTDALITTYSFVANSTNRFKNVTLIIKGLQGTTTGTNIYGVMVLNYF